jgi:2'-5' RNA ligase
LQCARNGMHVTLCVVGAYDEDPRPKAKAMKALREKTAKSRRVP